MSEFFDPYNADRPLMLKCSCGRDHSPADHHAEVAADAAAATLRARSETAEFEAYSQEFIEATLVKALFPQDAERRNFLRAVGKKQRWPPLPVCCPWQACKPWPKTKHRLKKQI
jgi:nitrate/nitrite transport system substrate-binding protein